MVLALALMLVDSKLQNVIIFSLQAKERSKLAEFTEMYVKENKETEEEFSRLQSELQDLKDKNVKLVSLKLSSFGLAGLGTSALPRVPRL